MFMFIMATLPSTFILYLWAVLVWQWYNRFCLSEMCLKWQRRSKVPPNARCVPSYERKGWVPPWSFSRAAHRKEMSYWTPLWLEMKQGFFTTLLNVRRRWWGARRSHGVVLWLGDTEASPYNLVNKPIWFTIFLSVYIYICQSSFVPRCIPDSHPYRITSAKCRINTVVSPDDGHTFARNM